MRGQLREWANDNVSSQAFQQSNIWNGKAARIMLDSALKGHGTVNSIWPVINAHVLQKTFKAAAQNRIH
jgi:hypothetical protein